MLLLVAAEGVGAGSRKPETVFSLKMIRLIRKKINERKSFHFNFLPLENFEKEQFVQKQDKNIYSSCRVVFTCIQDNRLGIRATAVMTIYVNNA